MFKIALCDDERDECEKLQRHIRDFSEKYDYDIRCECFGSGEALLETECDFDLFFVDFQMGGINGLELTKRLKIEKGVEAEVIFLTAYSSFVACEAYEVDAYRVLSKPVNKVKLYEALNSIFEPIYDLTPIKLKIDGIFNWILPRDIAYVEAAEKHCILRIKNEDVEVSKQLKEFDRELSKKLFFRVSKSYIVNFKYVKGYNSKTVVMKNGFEIPVGKDYYKDFQEAYDRFVFQCVVK